MDKTAFSQHKETIAKAVKACRERTYWSHYSESPKGYGEGGQEAGEKAFMELLGNPYPLDQINDAGYAGGEKSPFGLELNLKYPACAVETLVSSAKAAQKSWAKASFEDRALLCVELISRINKLSHLMAYATMHTTGQPWMMSFQAGGPHAQDRALEAVAYAYDAMAQIPQDEVVWEKPQGKQPPIVLAKHFEIVPRGVALVIGCATFPNWNSYPGLFASLVCGNPVIVKPHPMAILPLAITVAEGQKLLKEAGFDPHVLQLAVDTVAAPITQKLAQHKDVKIIDFTGGPVFGQWLEDNIKHAQLYTEKAGVNSVVIDSADDIDAVAKNLALSVSLYSGQMCTAPQNIFVPAEGVETASGKKSFAEVVAALTKATGGLLGDDARAVEVLGAVQNPETIKRLEGEGKKAGVVMPSRAVAHPKFPEAKIHTPVFVELESSQADRFSQEMFGPIVYIVKTKNTDESLKLASGLAKEKGAISAAVYTTCPDVQERAQDLFFDAGVNVSFNLTGNIYVNQSAAFSDFHVTGANPAGNAALSDAAFVSNRFRVIASRVLKPAACAEGEGKAAAGLTAGAARA
ncbi:MAG: phenylacetic acid degradation protein PaaN [Cyanobacteria bacterium SZAS TMP-1]|nr:phenylacetic acid degradation protein PaaN [Cyanobacteria bacterium SZAS TMP-1]